MDEKERRKNPDRKKQSLLYKNNPNNKLRTKDLALKRLFGIDLKEYNEMLLKQNNSCAICQKQHADKAKRTLAVDHCHKTGEVRGLLCTNCNLALGNFKDNTELMQKAINYLKGNI